jgi:hypothetical protein
LLLTAVPPSILVDRRERSQQERTRPEGPPSHQSSTSPGTTSAAHAGIASVSPHEPTGRSRLLSCGILGVSAPMRSREKSASSRSECPEASNGRVSDRAGDCRIDERRGRAASGGWRRTVESRLTVGYRWARETGHGQPAQSRAAHAACWREWCARAFAGFDLRADGVYQRPARLFWGVVTRYALCVQGCRS